MHVLDRLSDEAKKDFWASLALRYSDDARPRLLAKILRHYGSAWQAYKSLTSGELLVTFDDFAKKIPASFRAALRNESWRKPALLEWQDAQKTDCEVILWTDYRYPLALKQLADAPLFFYAKGDTGLLSYPSLAIVGSRNASSKGEQKAREIAGELASLGLAVVSGMARGIDQSAHRGALSVQGKTIAVLGTGINVVYPKEHTELYREIAENGLIISEFSPFTKPLAQNFPIRNRLITGISEGALIVEAALKSGSLITARLALEQNKNVYVCRPLGENHSLGGQKLLEEGALPVDDAYTIVADLAPNLSGQYENLRKKKAENQATIQIEENKISVQEQCRQKNSKQIQRAENNKIEPQETIQEAGQEAEQETHIYPKPLPKKKYAAYSILARPGVDEELQPLMLDFGAMAQSILNKKNPNKKIFNSYKKEAQKEQKKKNPDKKIEESTHIQKKIVSDNPVLQILACHEQLTADEILLYLQEQGVSMDMAELSSELLMQEVEGTIVKEAGAAYRVCYE